MDIYGENTNVVSDLTDIKNFWYHKCLYLVTYQILIAVILQRIKNYMNIWNYGMNSYW